MPATLGARAACERAPGPGAEHEAPPPLMHASLERVALARDVNGTRVGLNVPLALDRSHATCGRRMHSLVHACGILSFQHIVRDSLCDIRCGVGSFGKAFAFCLYVRARARAALVEERSAEPRRETRRTRARPSRKESRRVKTPTRPRPARPAPARDSVPCR